MIFSCTDISQVPSTETLDTNDKINPTPYKMWKSLVLMGSRLSDLFLANVVPSNDDDVAKALEFD